MKRTLVTSLLLLSLTAAALAQTAAPRVIPMQARLTKQDGTVYANTNYTIFFQLYDQPVGGSVLWSERHRSVGIINGMINVFLGSIKSFDATDNPKGAVTFDKVRYLGITVDADDNPNTSEPEMVPRQMIIPAFWAKTADNAIKLNNYGWGDLLTADNPLTGKLTGAKLEDATIAAGKLAANAVVFGNIAAGAVTNINIGNGAITQDKLAPRTAVTNTPGSIGNFVLSQSLASKNFGGDYGHANNTFIAADNLTATITTSGRPVYVTLVGATADPTSTSGVPGIYGFSPSTSETESCFVLRRGGTPVGSAGAAAGGGGGYAAARFAPGMINFIDFPPAGTHTYDLGVKVFHAATRMTLTNVRLAVFEF